MLVSIQYTDTEIKQLLKTITVIADTREQENSHVLDYFNKKSIPYTTKKLDYGDYSFLLPANEQLGIQRDIYFTNQIAVERKNSLEELSTNLTKERTRFESELLRSSGAGAKMYLIAEGGSYEKIVSHQYNTQYVPRSFIATLKSYEARYNLSIGFTEKKHTGQFIYLTFYYFLREHLKK